MKSSTERILTTHVGSLPRPDGLYEILDSISGANLTRLWVPVNFTSPA